MRALLSAAMASPSAVRTVGFAVFSPNGVLTGSLTLKPCENGDGCAPLALLQNRPNSTAPRWSMSQCRFQRASTKHALATATLPRGVVGAKPWKLRHILTRPLLVSVAA